MKIKGTIVHGKQLGRTIGFPTANLQPDDPAVVTAQNGVYVALIAVEGYPEPMKCMLNQGSHPTVPEGAPTIEAHVLDFSGDLYGKRVAVEYLHFIRPEVRFGSLDELKAQIARDGETARGYFRSLEEKE